MLASNGVHISSRLTSVMGIQCPVHLGLCQNCRDHCLPQGIVMEPAQGNFLTGMQVKLPPEEHFFHDRPELAIVPRELYDRAQREIAARRKPEDCEGKLAARHSARPPRSRGSDPPRRSPKRSCSWRGRPRASSPARSSM